MTKIRTREMIIKAYLDSLQGRLNPCEKTLVEHSRYLLQENFHLFSVLVQSGINPDAYKQSNVGKSNE